MLLSGKTIKEAEIWYERARNREPKPTALHREFIEASKNQKRKKAIKIGGIVGAGLATIGLGGLLAKLLLGNDPNEDEEKDKDKTTQVEARDGEDEIYAIANKAAGDAVATIEADPRTAALMAAAALHLVAATPVVAGSDPDRALRSALDKTRGRALVDELNAGSGKPIAAVAISPNGSKAVATSGKDAKVWDLAGGKPKPLYLRGHQSPIVLAEATPDGRWLVTAAEDRTMRLWDLRAEDPGTDARILREHKGTVDRVDFSTDGRWMISSSSEDGHPRIWDLHAADPSSPTGSISGGHEGAINDVALAANGNAAYTVGEDGSIKMWSLDNGRVGKRVALTGHEGPVLAVDVSNDGHWLISASQDMTARMWDLTSPAPWRNAIVLQGHTGPVTKVAISEDSKLAVTASSDNTLRIWELDAKDPAVTGVTFKGHSGVINDLRLDRSGTWAVTAGKDAKVFAWNLAKRDRVVEFVEFPGHTREASSIAISADGRFMISGSIDGNAFVWDYRGGKDSSNGNYFPARSHAGVINDVDVSRDGKRFISAGGDGKAVLWEFEQSGRPFPRDVLVGHQKPINTAVLAPGGRWAATAGQDMTIRVWDIVKEDPSKHVQLLEGHTGEVMDLVFSPDGSKLFSCAADNSVRAWDADSGWAPTELVGHGSEVVRLGINPAGTFLISSDIRGELRSWDLNAPLGAPTQQFQAHEREIWALAFSEDGKHMLSGSADRNARLWFMSAKGLEDKAVMLRGHQDTVNSASFSPDGHWIATGSRDGTVLLWDLASAHPEEGAKKWDMLDGNGVEWVRFGPDSKRLYAGNGDGSIHIWYPEPLSNRSDHQVLRGHEKKISGMAMPASGGFLLTGSYDGTARVWPMNPGEMIALGCYAAGRSPTEQEWQTWVPGQPYKAICG